MKPDLNRPRGQEPPLPAQRFRYSFIKIFSGSDLSTRRLPLMRVTAAEPDPVLWLTACAHGDEVGGIVIVQEIFRYLKKNPLRRGTVHAFPLMNPLGFESATRHITFSGEDLNRAFPGKPNGTLAERIAFDIFDAIAKTNPRLVLDLHNDWRKSIPYVLLDPPSPGADDATYDAARQAAAETGFLVVGEDSAADDAKGWERTLSGALSVRGVPALTLELGEAFVVNERHVEFGVRAIVNVLASLGMIDPPAAPFRYDLPDRVRGRVLVYSHRPVSTSSGIIRFLAEPGQIVRAGQPVARVYNAFGRLLETIRAGREGVVLGHADSSVSFPGVPVVAVANLV